jgi:hypothetical protein
VGNCVGEINKPVLEFLNNLWGARNRVGIGLSYRLVRLHRLAELIPWNQFSGSLNSYKFGLCDGILEQSIGARNRVVVPACQPI